MQAKIFLRCIGLSLVLGLCLFSTSCGGDDNGAPATLSPPIGATATLFWDPSTDPTVTAYDVHYGKQPSGQRGSCDYEQSQRTKDTTATLAGLDFNTRYYVAVSAFNGQHSACSDEVSFVTDPA